MKEIILAIKPKYLELILNGTKTAEVRRTRPARPCDMPNYLYLYHKGCIHGMAAVRTYRYLTCGCFSLNKGEYHEACLSGEEARGYLQISSRGVIYKLGKVERFLKPIPVPCRPQSWIYMTDEVRAIVYEPNRKGNQQ